MLKTGAQKSHGSSRRKRQSHELNALGDCSNKDKKQRSEQLHGLSMFTWGLTASWELKVYISVVWEGCTFSCAYGLFAEHRPKGCIPDRGLSGHNLARPYRQARTDSPEGHGPERNGHISCRDSKDLSDSVLRNKLPDSAPSIPRDRRSKASRCPRKDSP